MTEEEVEAVIENFAKEDDSSGKTFSRLFVEKFLSNVSCKTQLNVVCVPTRSERRSEE